MRRYWWFWPYLSTSGWLSPVIKGDRVITWAFQSYMAEGLMVHILVSTRMAPSQGTHPYTTPGTPLHCLATRTAGLLTTACWKSAMGSKWTLRNSQIEPQVNLSTTICLLALILSPCCKNQPVPKAPDYLGLSYPYSILTRPRTLP